jgi:restriction system protein
VVLFKCSSRVSWARTYLQKAGLLEATKRGHFRITDRGLNVLKNKPNRIDGELLSQFEEFREFQGRKKDRKNEKAEAAISSSETPIESLATQYERLREALASELLERVKKSSPQFLNVS